MNGRQSGAVHYLPSLSLYYYSPGLLYRFISLLTCVAPCSLPFSSSSTFFPSPSLVPPLFFFVSLTTSNGLSLPLRLSPFSNELSRSHAEDQVLRDKTLRTKLAPRTRLKCAFCIGKLAKLAVFSDRLSH